MSSPAGPLDVFNTHLHANYSHKVRAKAVNATAAAGGSHLETNPRADPGAVPKTGPKPMAPAGDRKAKAAAAWKTAEVLAGGSNDPIGFDVPLDAFAPFRVSQICELAQVRQGFGG